MYPSIHSLSEDHERNQSMSFSDDVRHISTEPIQKSVLSHEIETVIISTSQSLSMKNGYWSAEVDDHFFMVLFEPHEKGHMRSMMKRIYRKFINHIIIHDRLTDPGDIILSIHQKIEKEFDHRTKKVDTAANMAVMCIPPGRSHLYFSGAQIDLIKLENGKSERILGDKTFVGNHFEENRYYNTVYISHLKRHKSKYFISNQALENILNNPGLKKSKIVDLNQLIEHTGSKGMKNSKLEILDYLNQLPLTSPHRNEGMMIGCEF